MNNLNIWKSWIENKQLTEEQIKFLNSLFEFINLNFSYLKLEIKWNQPMFILNKTFIIAFSAYKKHLSIGLNPIIISKFKNKLEFNNYEYTNNLFKIQYTQQINFDLINKIINEQIRKKKEHNKFF